MNLVKNFDRYPSEQLVATGLDIVLHPTRPLVLMKIDGTAVMVGLDADGLLQLVRALLECNTRLTDRTLAKES